MDFLYYVSIAKYLALYTTLYYLLGLVFILKIQTYSYIRREYNKIVNAILPIVTIFVLFSFCDGDNFHYIKWFYYANNNGDIIDTAPQEAVYQLLSFYFKGNYFLFRILVWGSSILIFCITSKRLKIPPRVSIICLYCLFIPLFSYARATLGMCIYFCGFSFLIKPNKHFRFFNLLFGIFLILVSSIFHRSMLVLIILTAPVMIFPLLKDNFNFFIKLLLYIVCIVVVMISTISLIEIILKSLDLNMLYNKFYSYNNLEKESKGIYVFILESAISILMITCLYITGKAIYFNKIYDYTAYRLFIFALTIFVVSFTLSVMGAGFVVFAYRIKYMCVIPITLLVAYCVNKGFVPYRKFLALESFGTLVIFYRLLFYFYLTTKGAGIDINSVY